ncbi:MAG: 2-hydroxychromene-2-carboxylate isomerase [Burkholderiaceae bacterium]|jgi:2-hydroxychromene-2-carboxylate isomerase|nr:2-hydroxychromene-2-carboxylate isomerase [Burkholderiaceae bacterium]
MPAPIEFYFDFTSPYAYLLSEQIEAVATKYGRSVKYRPTLLGVVFKQTGGAPLIEIPMKGVYSRRDFARSARFAGVKYEQPDPFPMSSVNAARALLWLQGSGSAKSVSFVHTVFRAYFTQNRNISEMPVLLSIAEELGIDQAALAAAVQDAAIKDKLKAAVEESIRRGVFGAPFVFVDGEPFWGNDRLAQIERWLQYGPF